MSLFKYFITFIAGASIGASASYFYVNHKWSKTADELNSLVDKYLSNGSSETADEPVIAEVELRRPIEDIDPVEYMSSDDIPENVVITKSERDMTPKEKFNKRMMKMSKKTPGANDEEPSNNDILDSKVKYNSYFRESELDNTPYSDVLPADPNEVRFVSAAAFDYAVGMLPGVTDRSFAFPEDIPESEMDFFSEADLGTYKEYIPSHIIYFSDGTVWDSDNDVMVPHPDAYFGDGWEDLFNSETYDSGVYGFIFCFNDKVMRSYAIEIMDMSYGDYINMIEEEGGEK